MSFEWHSINNLRFILQKIEKKKAKELNKI